MTLYSFQVGPVKPKKRRDDGTSKDVKASVAKVMQAQDKEERLMS